MKPDCITVYFPCHSLHDFPTWLEEAEADSLLSAWTGAWHPSLLAAVGAVPQWASADLPPHHSGITLGIVPAPWDDRFAAQADSVCTAGSCWVRGVASRSAIVSAAAALVGVDDPAGDGPGTTALAADFYALGLATLLAELLARRMRSETGLEATGFADSAVAAARAAMAGDDGAARAGLLECFGCLEATRAKYYPVDIWLLDLVLLAESTLGGALDHELESTVPAALVATGRTIEQLASRNPAALARIRSRCAAGTLDPAGGRYDSKPLDECTPEQILRSFEQGRTAWSDHAGVTPVTYAQQAGGSSAILPQLLSGLGFTGMIWTLFDGTPLPNPAACRIRWEGAGGAYIDGVARPPLDARRAQTILTLHEKIGEALDHDHTAVIQFAHHPGTASPWFDALRQIGTLSSVLGKFVTPADFFRRTAGAGTTVSFEPDAFPMSLPAASDSGAVAAAVAAAAEEATRLLAVREPLVAVLPRPATPLAAEATSGEFTAKRGLGRGLFGLFSAGRRASDELVLEHASLRVHVQRQTGGLLSVRRPEDRGNRLSQRLAVRTTRPAPRPGQPWEDPAERAEYSGMEADSTERVAAAAGRGEAIVSRGRLVGAQRHEVGTYTQRIELVDGLPLVLIDIDVRLASVPHGPLLEHHAACRFAWNEHEDCEVRRSLHTQSIPTERGWFTAPWFIELLGSEPSGVGDTAGGVTILTGGLPWHGRSSPHMLDSILPSSPAHSTCQVAVGVGLHRPWDAALCLLGAVPTALWQHSIGLTAVPSNVRMTAGPVRFAGERLVAARIGLLESAGRSGEVRVVWGADVARVRRCDALGQADAPDGDADGVAIDGRTTVVSLGRYEWLHLDVEFCK